MLEVAIIGRGAAGLACAIRLAQRGQRVGVFGPATVIKTIETAPPATVLAITDVGVNLAALAGARPSAGTLSLWGDNIPRAVDYVYQTPGTGWEVDRSALDGQLAHAAQAAGAHFFVNRISDVRRHGEGWILELATTSQPQYVSAKFLILANGRTSTTFGLAERRSTDALVAVSFLAEQTVSDSRAWIEARSAGWWYSVRGNRDQRAVAFFTDAALLPARRVNLHDWCAASLAQSRLTSNRIRSLVVGSIRVACAASRRLGQPAGEGWAAIGDAAAAFDPISSTGLRFAFESARLVLRTCIALAGINPTISHGVIAFGPITWQVYMLLTVGNADGLARPFGTKDSPKSK